MTFGAHHLLGSLIEYLDRRKSPVTSDDCIGCDTNPGHDTPRHQHHQHHDADSETLDRYYGTVDDPVYLDDLPE